MAKGKRGEEMTEKEFLQYVEEVQNFYGQNLSRIELNVWYENLKFMTVQRFNYIIAEIYKTSKFMPKLADVLQMHKSIPYAVVQEETKISGDCDKCNSTGYVLYNKVIEGNAYTYVAVCDCGRQKRYDGRECQDAKNKSEYYIPTAKEIDLQVKSSKPSKEQVLQSMQRLKNSSIISESIREIIRREFVKMR